MVDNPLFPGYKPRREGDSTNPLYPGYSEGQRPYRPPRGTPLGSFEYNADYWLKQIDQMSFDFGNIPKWFWERYENDFRDNLKAVYSPEAVPIEQLDDYDQDVFPGVSNVSLTLDPIEWKDPKKVLESTAKSWIKAGTGLRFKKEGWGLEAWPVDLTDYDTNVRTSMWKVAFGLQDPASDLGNAGAEAVVSATKARAGEDTGGDRIFRFTEAEYVVGPVKGYESMAKKAVEAQRYIKGGPKRDTKHDDFAGAMVSSINEELNGKYEYVLDKVSGYKPVYKKDPTTNKITTEIETDDKGYEKYYNSQTKKEAYKKAVLVDDGKGQGGKIEKEIFVEYRTRTGVFEELFENKDQAEAYRNAALIFKEKEDLASDMAHPTISGAISGPFGITSALMQRKLGNKNKEATMEGIDVPGGTKTRLETRIDLLKGNINDRIKPGGKIDKIVKNIRDIDPVSAEAVQKYADQYKEYLTKVKEALDAYDGNDTALLNKLSNITVKGKSLTGGTLGNPSIHREFLRQIESDILIPGKITRVDKKFQIGTYLKDLEQRAMSGTNKAGEKIDQIFERENQEYKGFFANQARIVGARLEVDRGSYAIEEFYDAVTQGKFLERYVWNRLSKKMIGYTPGELVKKGLGSVGYFGLNIDDDTISDKLKNNGLFNSIFRHKFQVQIDNSEGVFDKFKGVSVIKTKFLGSKDLAAVGTLGGILSNVKHLENDDLLKLITGDARLVDSKGINKDIAWVLGVSKGKIGDNQIENFWDKVPGFWKKDEHHLRNVQEQIDNFRNWLILNGKELGITITDFKNMSDPDRKKVLALFNALNKENQFYGSLKITKEFSGALQRIGVGLNKLQDKIFGFALFQKTIKPLLQMKNIVAEKISELVSKFLTEIAKKGIHGLTGGASVVLDYLLEKVLKPAIRFVVRKVVEFGQNFVGALAQGNISKAMEQADKELVAVTKFAMYVIGVPLIVIYILVYGLFGTVLSSISPVDPTKDNSGYGGYPAYAGFPQGENNLIKIEKDVIVNGVTNPTESIPNDQLPVTVTYVLKITTKVDLAMPVNYTDIVSRIYSDNGNTASATIKTWTDSNPDSYVAGQTTEITLDLGTINYKDSLIKNEFTVTTPAYESYTEDTVRFVRYFRIGQPPSSIDCFTITGSGLTTALEGATMDALMEIEPKTGAFLSKLCANNSWEIEFDSSSPECGWAGTAGKVVFGSGCSSAYYLKDGVMPYLLAHELAHKYRGLYNTAEAIDASIAGLDGRTLPTYDLNCGATDNSLSEDFSETVGNTVRINVFGNCASLIISMYPNAATRYEDFWNRYWQHRDYVQNVTFN